MSSKRFRLWDFLVKMCRACEWPRLILPVAVSRNRLAAPLCVFSFGIIAPISNLRFVIFDWFFFVDVQRPQSLVESQIRNLKSKMAVRDSDSCLPAPDSS